MFTSVGGARTLLAPIPARPYAISAEGSIVEPSDLKAGREQALGVVRARGFRRGRRGSGMSGGLGKKPSPQLRDKDRVVVVEYGCAGRPFLRVWAPGRSCSLLLVKDEGMVSSRARRM